MKLMTTNGEMVEVTQIVAVPGGASVIIGDSVRYAVALAVVRHDHGGSGLFPIVQGEGVEYEVEMGE